MPNEQLPITPAIVTWARQRAGLSIDEAIAKFSRIRDWEQGIAFPTYPQLEQLSEAFKIPIAVFFFPAPPATPPIEQTFRTLPDAELVELPRQIKALLRKAKALQINLGELTGNRNPSRRLITRDLDFSPAVAIPSMASIVREYIGVDLQEQISWEDTEDALKQWRQRLKDVGIFVFKDAFKSEEYSGFCLYDEELPIIYVNNSSTKTRQIFTLFHELAHLLFHTSGIDKIADDYIEEMSGDAKRIEVLCNRFAAQFLLPQDALRREIEGRAPDRALAEALAEKYNVSRETVFRRFLDLGIINDREYGDAVALWNGQRQNRGPSGGDHYWTKLSYLGRDYVSLALQEYYQNRIDIDKLSEYLDTKPKNIAALEEYYRRGGS